jgi:hypothetical protein
MPAPWLIALAFIVGLLVLIPARRLTASGLSSRAVGAFAVGLWLLGMLLAIRPLGGRFLVPFVLILYLAPFIATPEVVGRVIRRGGRGRRPLKDVTPTPESPPAAAGEPAPAAAPAPEPERTTAR